MKKILFVCLGNICRSPAAHAIFEKMLDERGVSDRYLIDSAGTGDWFAGDLPYKRMRESAAERGYMLDSISRQINTDDLHYFDMIIVMDASNYQDVKKLMHESQYTKLHLISEFGQIEGVTDIPDPYYEGEKSFVHVLELLEFFCEKILDSLEHKH